MSDQTDDKRYGAFLPVMFMGLALLLFFTWQLVAASQVLGGARRIVIQQDDLMVRSAQAEEALKAMMLDLLALAERDASARVIVRKYNIAFTPPAAGALNLGTGAETMPGTVPEVDADVPEAPVPPLAGALPEPVAEPMDEAAAE